MQAAQLGDWLVSIDDVIGDPPTLQQVVAGRGGGPAAEGGNRPARR